MSNCNKGFCTLGNVSSVKVSDAEFGDHVMNVSTGGDDTGTLFEEGNNFGNSFCCAGREGNDRFSAFAESGTADEIHLTTDTAVDIAPDGIGTDLPGEVNFDGAVDGGDFIVSANDGSVVDVSDIKHGNHGVVVNEIIEPAGSHRKGGNDFSGMFLFKLSVDDTALDKRQDGIGKHFGVNAEIFMVV